MPPPDHFQRLRALLDLEAAAEAAQVAARGRQLAAAAAEAQGVALADLVVLDEALGLGGRVLLTLGKRHRRPLPWTRLQPGAPVWLTAAAGGTASRGVVSERGADRLTVALPDWPDDWPDQPTLRADLAPDEVSRDRQRAALDRARAAHGDRLAQLRAVLLGDRDPEFDLVKPIEPLDPGLNAGQREAVAFALAARDVALLHGPPGTGKTTTVAELIRQAVRRGEKVLACAPSNLAVDNLMERLVASGERAVRLGHPARVLPELRAHTLDVLVGEHPDVALARKLTKEAAALFRQAGRYTRARPEPGARQQLRQEARSLLADARRMEALATDHLLDSATVLCATTTGLDDAVLGRRAFDLAVIDEAGQGTEPGAWLPLLRCRRVVLAGDHCQLPPTVVSPQAAAEGLGRSLLERLADLYGATVLRRLGVQYRMHAAIMAFLSAEFYDGALVADPSVAAHRLADLPGVTADARLAAPFQFLDTAGAGHDEAAEPDGESRFNPGEAALVVREVRRLLAAGVRPEDVAVITPYAAQVRHLRGRLEVPGLEIDSIDGFQGREKEAVVLSLVRSNLEGEIGFLADVRRLNVALTRARRRLLVIGDSATLAHHPFYRRFLDHAEAAGAYGTVWEDPLEE